MSRLDDIINILEKGESPTRSDCAFFVNKVFSGDVNKSIITKILKLFNKVGYSSEQLSGFAESMRKASKRVECKKQVVDNCGTGGDAMQTFNISTTASLIASCCKVGVAKHGNKSITSKSGSADLLLGAGVKINIPPDSVSDCIEKLNFGFMFAPLHHSSMRYVADSRKEIAPEKTIFNLLGPLTNPAGAKRQLIGVYDARYMDIIAETLSNLGSSHAKIVHSNDGLDEVSLFDATAVTELINGKINSYDFEPSDYFNISQSRIQDIRVSSIDESLSMFYSVINNEESPARDISILNSAFLLSIAFDDISISDSIKLCKKALSESLVKDKLDNLITLTQSYRDA